jgi:hypothetical protein
LVEQLAHPLRRDGHVVATVVVEHHANRIRLPGERLAQLEVPTTTRPLTR